MHRLRQITGEVQDGQAAMKQHGKQLIIVPSVRTQILPRTRFAGKARLHLRISGRARSAYSLDAFNITHQPTHKTCFQAAPSRPSETSFEP